MLLVVFSALEKAVFSALEKALLACPRDDAIFAP
jgi:hypothetical protein